MRLYHRLTLALLAVALLCAASPGYAKETDTMPTRPPADAGKQMHPKLAAPIQRLSIPLGQFTPNATKTTLGHVFDRESVIREIHVASDVVPSDADGTLLLHADINDVSEGALDTIVNGFDTEAQLVAPAKRGVKAALAAETAENELTAAAGDVLQFRQVNNSAAIDVNPNLIVTVLYQVTELVET